MKRRRGRLGGEWKEGEEEERKGGGKEKEKERLEVGVLHNMK